MIGLTKMICILKLANVVLGMFFKKYQPLVYLVRPAKFSWWTPKHRKLLGGPLLVTMTVDIKTHRFYSGLL